MSVNNAGQAAVITQAGLQNLIDILREQGFSVVAPVIKDGAIVYGEITRVDQLPTGWTDQQEAGTYRLHRRDDNALFGYNVGPASWKQFFHPEHLRLWRASRSGNGIELIANTDPPPRYALLGVRSCELEAIRIQDSVFSSAVHADYEYQSRRDESLIIAVNCGEAASTCFCSSMGTGPRVSEGSAFDLSLTEQVQGDSSRFLLETGSVNGETLLQLLPHEKATENDFALSYQATDLARSQMGRTLNTKGVKELLQDNPEHPRWQEVADRCLSCANCTMVCPTCFCTTVEEVSDVREDHVERWRSWDSCFTMNFSYIHGGAVRQSTESRYRQWLTHKFANWIDQFDSSGCVGCGRCISWCPVGIDITQEVAAIRSSVAESEEGEAP